MVASKAVIADCFVPPPELLLSGRLRLFRITREGAEAMVRAGLVPEDASTELLHGVLFHTDRSKLGEDPLSVGEDHSVCVEALSDLRSRINNADRHVRSQQPLICGDDEEPQPDFMVLRGTLRSYTSKPSAADAFCVVEVADSSYERDAGMKLVGYALAGVAQYIIINLRNRTAEVYTNPNPAAGTYAAPQIVTAEGSVALRVGEAEVFELSLADLLPGR
jgi:Uma2 family endonuclease